MIENLFITAPVMRILMVLFGIILLIVGRRFFWLTVGILGFLTGLVLVVTFLEVESVWLMLIVALIAGIAGAVIAVLLQKVAVMVAGFLMGGYLLVWLVHLFGLNVDPWVWLVYVIGGITGSLLSLALFEVALIALSALVGAAMIVQVTSFSPWVTTVLFFILLVGGIAIQAKTLSRDATA
jgi:hypothetical protein